MKRIGLALGGGGARGFAHIPVLEVFDELGIRPCCIAGTSIGAILGAIYASGRSAADIVEMIRPLLEPRKPSSFREIFRTPESFRFLELIDPHFSPRHGGLIKGEKFLDFLYGQMQVSRFEELEIPLKVVATDFWRRRQVVFESGELLPAVRASMALPYVFSPVFIDRRVLVDGGLVNNVPHDLLDPECDIRIAVDIRGKSSEPADKIPSPRDAVFHTYEVMMDALAQEKRKHNHVDIYLMPPLLDVNVFDFHKAESIYAQGLALKDDFKRQLERLLTSKHSFFGRLGRK